MFIDSSCHRTGISAIPGLAFKAPKADEAAGPAEPRVSGASPDVEGAFWINDMDLTATSLRMMFHFREIIQKTGLDSE